MPLQPQAALEQAVLLALQTATGDGGLGLRVDESGRQYDGQPPAITGQRYVSVWSDGAREAGTTQSAHERMNVNVTVSKRIVQPKDRLVQHRDEIEALLNSIRAVVWQDSYTYVISNAAAVLAGITGPGSFGVEPLRLERFGPVEEKGPDWFSAVRKTTGQYEVALSQTAYFTGAMRAQHLTGMT